MINKKKTFEFHYPLQHIVYYNDSILLEFPNHHQNLDSHKINILFHSNFLLAQLGCTFRKKLMVLHLKIIMLIIKVLPQKFKKSSFRIFFLLPNTLKSMKEEELLDRV